LVQWLAGCRGTLCGKPYDANLDADGFNHLAGRYTALMDQDETYRRVQAQFGRTADAYVASASHARGAELEQMVALAQVLHPGAMADKAVLDVATGGGHTALAFARARRSRLPT
jgi:hypothetical protein